MERLTTERHAQSIEAQPIEIVERKGLGHPDTMCDAIAEEIGRALVAAYLARTGRVLPMNVDKALLAGGASTPRFGGGTVEVPMRLVLGGRAHAEAIGGEDAVAHLAVETARTWIRQNLRFVDPERHVVFQTEIHETSAELQGVIGEVARANDTSVGVGYAPLSRVEQTVLEVDAFLAECRPSFPEIGEDVKLMAVRRGDELDLTLAIAFVDRFVPDATRYFSRKEELCTLVAERVRRTGRFRSIRVGLDLLDDPAHSAMYLTVTGTSAEAGDDGEVGRGNRVNGVISFGRPMSLEAAAGKNPAAHVGKIYNVLAHRAAARIAELPGVADVHVALVSQIGRPIDDPLLARAEVALVPGHPERDVLAAADAMLEREVLGVASVVDDLVNGRVRVF